MTTVALIATGSWIAAMLLLIAVSRPSPGVAPIRDGWPVDPPALAALLLSPYRQRATVAARATLLDLVARGVLIAETDADGHRWLRVTRSSPGLRPYERHVWDQVVVRTAQGGGRAPADRLDMGSTEHANAWYSRFTELLEADGRGLGLVAPRVPAGIRVALWLALLAVFGIACAAAIVAHVAALIGFLLLGYRLISLPAGRLRRLVPRGAGVAAAAGCRALRTALTGADAKDLSARAGDRRLAYAVAVGAVEGGVDPFTPADGDAVWSNRDGTWRKIPLAHGRGLLFGSAPAGGIAALIGALPFLAIWAVLLGYFTVRMSGGRAAEIWPPSLVAAGWLCWLALAWFIGRYATRAIFDMTHPPLVIVGPVVHLESRHGGGEDPDHFAAAIDDGRGGPAIVYEIDRATHDRLRLYDWLRLAVTPKLGHVRSSEILADEPIHD